MRTITALFGGLGSTGPRHLKNLHNLCTDRGWTLQADALRSDLHRPLRDGVAELLHAQYTDLAAAPARYDMVFITNPTSLHVEALQQVKGRGEALFIEKPIFSAEQTGLNLADCLPENQKAYVAAPMRWCGVMLALKDLLPTLHPYCARPRPGDLLRRPGHLLQLPAGLAAGCRLPHGLQRPQGAGRRRHHRPHPRVGLPCGPVRRAAAAVQF